MNEQECGIQMNNYTPLTNMIMPRSASNHYNQQEQLLVTFDDISIHSEMSEDILQWMSSDRFYCRASPNGQARMIDDSSTSAASLSKNFQRGHNKSSQQARMIDNSSTSETTETSFTSMLSDIDNSIHFTSMLSDIDSSLHSFDQLLVDIQNESNFS